MKIVFQGPEQEIAILGVGLFPRGKPIEVDDNIGNELIEDIRFKKVKRHGITK